MNERDSESLGCLLESRGYLRASSENEADICIFNTCSVRDQAERKALGKVGLMKKLKAEKPGMVLGIIGCMAQRLGDSLFQKLPHLDFVAGTDQLQSVPELIEEAIERHVQASATEMTPHIFRELDGHRPGNLFGYVSVMHGCNQFCTYCVVPYTRGREKSRPISDIVEEVKTLVAGGTKEILLLGQNITAYGVAEAIAAGAYRQNEFSAFADLLSELNEIEGLERIRFTSPHVKFMTDKFVRAICTLPKVCKSFHVPMQSGSDRILKLMNRSYSAAEYRERIGAIRALAPQATFSTDIIVGFCTETEAEFEMTRELMNEIGFDMAYIFRYSQRSGTRAALTLQDDVPEEEKHRRNQILLADLAAGTAERNKAYLGTTVEVLAEGVSKRNPNRWCGRTDLNKVVLFPPATQGCRPGELLRIKIDRTTENSLFGKIADR